MVYLLFFHRLADRDLWSSHEARAAMDAQTILDEGAWGLPHLYGGQPELQKPPLYYWMVALIARCRGGVVDAWAVRLPATLSAVACVLGIFWFGWRRGRPIAGLIAAGVLATAIHFTWLARVGRIDMPLTLAVGVVLCTLFLRTAALIPTVACHAFAAVLDRPFHRGQRGPRKHGTQHHTLGLACCYLALAAGLLLKGPIALVLPAAALLLLLLIERQLPAPWQFRRIWNLAHRLGLWWGLPLAVGIAAPWFLWADVATNHELFQTFFWRHNWERALGENVVDRWSHPWWLYGPLFVANFLPWSLLLPLIGWLAWRNGWWRQDPEARFGCVWFLAMFGVLSCVSFKRADYLLPAYPGVALFLGCIGERWYFASAKGRQLAAGFATVAIGCVAGWVVYLHAILPAQDRQLEYRQFAAEVRSWAPAPARICFFRTEAHALAFHVGRPLDIFVEWDKLAAEAVRPEPQYVVMPLARWAECGDHVPAERFEKLLTSNHVKPLVLVRTRLPLAVVPADELADAGSSATAADRHATAQRPAAGAERPAGP